MPTFRYRWHPYVGVVLALLLLAGCASAPAPDPVANALKLRKLSAECNTIGEASLAAKRAGAVTADQGLQLAKYGFAACTAVDVATAALDLYRVSNRNAVLAHNFSVLETAAEATMAALKVLARTAGVQWSSP